MAEAAAPRGAVHFGVFELNFVTGELRKAGIKIKLQDQPFLVLAMLLERPGELVTREELRSRLWPSGSFGDFDHGLNVAVKKLRRALSDSAENPRFIETLTRRGYRFVGQVEHVVTAGSRETVASPGNVTEEFEATGDAPSSRAETVSRSYPGTRRLIEYGVVAILLAAAGFALWRWRRASAAPRVVTRFTISLPPSDQFSMGRGGLAISPDGSFLVYSATASKTGTRQLYLRPMDRNEATLIPGTEGAIGPFFSPDGEWVAFTAGGQLKKIPFRGGTPIALCARENMGAGSWSLDGTIFFAENLGPDGKDSRKLMRVSSGGGQPRDVTPAETTPAGFPPRWPQVLPAGDAILYVIGGTPAELSDDAMIVAQSLKTGERKTLIQGGTSPRYVSSSYLIYAQSGRLLAAPFDARRLELTGAAFPVAEDIWQGPGGYVAYDVSRNGMLVSLSSGERSVGNRSLNWIDRTGTLTPINASERHYSQPSLSPDGKHIAVVIGEPLRQSDIWVFDLEQHAGRQFTFSKAGERANAPLWTPDGTRLIYASGAHASSLFWKAADGNGPEESLFASDLTNRAAAPMIWTTSISPDGRLLVFQRGDQRQFDLWVLNLFGEKKAAPLLAGVFSRTYPQISPDGRWLAYTSNESGRPEIYVQPFPALGDKWLVSAGGGEEPRWARDGRQLFYRQADKMMAVDVQTTPAFKAHVPRLLFEGIYARSNLWTNYDVRAQGFVMLKEENEARANQVLRVVLNWSDELKSSSRPPGTDNR